MEAVPTRLTAALLQGRRNLNNRGAMRPRAAKTSSHGLSILLEGLEHHRTHCDDCKHWLTLLRNELAPGFRRRYGNCQSHLNVYCGTAVYSGKKTNCLKIS